MLRAHGLDFRVAGLCTTRDSLWAPCMSPYIPEQDLKHGPCLISGCNGVVMGLQKFRIRGPILGDDGIYPGVTCHNQLALEILIMLSGLCFMSLCIPKASSSTIPTASML